MCEIKSTNDFLVLFLEELSGNINDNIRWKVARNPFTPKHIAEKLSKTDPVNSIRMVALDSMQKSLLYSYEKPVIGNPESMDIFEFFEWLESASVLELEDFSNKSFEEKPLTLIEKFLGWLSIFIPNKEWESYRNKPTQYEIDIIRKIMNPTQSEKDIVKRIKSQIEQVKL